MNTAVMQRTDLMPRGKDGIGSGLLLAALVHAALVVALAFGVSWRASEPEGIEAELWAAVPQVAAQRAVEPEPPRPPPPKPEAKPEPVPQRAVPDAQIAIEKAKREREKEKKEQDEKKRAQEDKLKANKADKADADRRKKEEARKDEQLAAQREANIKRILGEAGATGTTPGTAAQTKGPSAAYAGRIKARVKPNILFADTVDGNPLAEVEVRVAPDGAIISSKLTKSSGIKAWDDAVLRAIEKTEILPRDVDGTIPSSMTLAFRPRDF